MRCGWWGRRRRRDTTPRRHVARKPPGVSHARCDGIRRDLVERSDVASGNASRPRFSPRHRTLRPPVGSGSRGEAPRSRHRRRQRRRHPGDRETAPLYVRLQSRRVRLPDHGLHVHRQPGLAPARRRACGEGDDGPTNPRPVRARAWRRHPHVAAQTRVQPGGLLRPLFAHCRGGCGSDAGATPLDADSGAGTGPRLAPRRGWHARRARAPARRARTTVGLTGILQLAAGILLAAAGVYFVLRPILRPEMERYGNRETENGSEGEDPDDDLSPRAVALRALKEIEFDRATGKLSDADYDALKAQYTAEVVTALRAESRDAGGEMRDAMAAGRTPHPASRLSHPDCPTHGARPEPNAEFCSECGRRLGSAPGYCGRCGAALEHDARYCHACGARVAA